MTITYDSLREFLAQELAIDNAEIGPDTLLFSSGLVDSFSLVSLMTHIENESGLMISPSDVKLENFDSLKRILDFVARSEAAAG